MSSSWHFSLHQLGSSASSSYDDLFHLLQFQLQMKHWYAFALISANVYVPIYVKGKLSCKFVCTFKGDPSCMYVYVFEPLQVVCIVVTRLSTLPLELFHRVVAFCYSTNTVVIHKNMCPIHLCVSTQTVDSIHLLPCDQQMAFTNGKEGNHRLLTCGICRVFCVVYHIICIPFHLSSCTCTHVVYSYLYVQKLHWDSLDSSNV